MGTEFEMMLFPLSARAKPRHPTWRVSADLARFTRAGSSMGPGDQLVVQRIFPFCIGALTSRTRVFFLFGPQGWATSQKLGIQSGVHQERSQRLEGGTAHTRPEGIRISSVGGGGKSTTYHKHLGGFAPTGRRASSCDRTLLGWVSCTLLGVLIS